MKINFLSLLIILCAQISFAGMYINQDAVEKHENSTCTSYFSHKQYKEALKCWESLSEKNNKFAQYDLGLCYYKGDIVTKDIEKAISLFEKSGENGYITAQKRVGKIYGKRKDFDKAMFWYQKAAEQNDNEAQFGLGLVHIMKNDFEKGCAWTAKAIENGYKPPQNIMSELEEACKNKN